MPNKLNELNAIASFGQPAKIDGYVVSTQTAKVILNFYSRLPHGLRRNYLSVPIDRMANIAYNRLGINPRGAYFQLAPSLQVVDRDIENLKPFVREIYQGEERIRKKYVVPFVTKSAKDVQKFIKKNKKAFSLG